MQCMRNAILPLKGLLPLNVNSPQYAHLLFHKQLPLPHPTPPFCHDIGKGVVPNPVTQAKER